MNTLKKAVIAGLLTACAGSAAYFKWGFGLGIKEYTGYALYMAILDDEICRNELAGNRIGGEAIVFPPPLVTLQERYHLFLNMNRGKSRTALQRQVLEMEQRRQESRKYLVQPKCELEVSIADRD